MPREPSPPDPLDFQALWQELSDYVGFSNDDAASLKTLHAPLSPHFAGIAEVFYQAIEHNAEAKQVFREGSAQIERQKTFLLQWMHQLFSGEYDDAYVRDHARIGRTHVRIGLPQRYMVSAMALVRGGLQAALEGLTDPPVAAAMGRRAIDRICDLELAVMLETYAEYHTTQIRASERLATLGQFSGFVGHELRNPLSVMQTSTHLLQRRLSGAEPNVKRHLERLTTQIRQCGQIVSSLQELTRDRPPDRQAVLLEEAVETARNALPELATVDLEVHIEPNAREPLVDPLQLHHLLVNLLSNAQEALEEHPTGSTIRLSARAEGGTLVLDIEDDGPGLGDHVLEQLFVPLHTTRARGLGLGLALCRRIAEKHGGSIEARNRPDGGACFSVRLGQALEKSL